jgi:hypothetical protein
MSIRRRARNNDFPQWGVGETLSLQIHYSLSPSLLLLICLECFKNYTKILSLKISGICMKASTYQLRPTLQFIADYELKTHNSLANTA